MATRPEPPFLPNGNGNAPFLIPTYSAPFPTAERDDLNLRQLLTIVQRRKTLIAGVAIAVTSVIWMWTLTQARVYEGKFQLLVEPVTAEQDLKELTKLTNQEVPPTTGLDYNTQIQVLRSPELMAPTIKRIQARYPALSYETLIQSLSVARFQETKILEIRYRGTDPEQIKFVLDEISGSYLKYSLQERQTALRQGIQFVDDQIDKLQLRVDKLQQQLQVFRQRNSFIEPDIQSEQLSKQVGEIAEQRLETQKELAEVRALYNTLQGRAGAVSALAEAPLYQKLLGQLRDIESKIAIESSRFRALNPTMQTLEDQRQSLMPLLRIEANRVLGDKLAGVATQIQILEVRSQAIEAADDFLNQQIKQLPLLSRQYNDLQRELKVATDSLNRFLATRESLQVDAAQKEIPWQTITAPAQPGVPISPNLPRNFLLGAVSGVLLGIVAALLAERLDNTFHSPNDLKDQISLPMLGVIPFNESLVEKSVLGSSGNQSEGLNNQGYPSPYVSSSFTEAFRSLHANIRLLSSDTPIRSLVISSALPGDGKSTASVHLAQAAAAMGQRVLLVDADLRRPKISRLLNLPNVRGLSNLITGNLELKQVIQQLPDAHPEAISGSNLFVLTSGQNPPDPTKLLSSQKMRHLVEQFQTIFDLVIYDTPPLVGLADSSLLAPHTDGLVLIVGLGRTERSALTTALDSLKLSQTTVLGIVANGIKNYTASSYSYYYSHYYHQNGNAPMNGKVKSES